MTDPAAPQAVDLTNCDREPIQFLGHVQPYGCLIAVSTDWVVQHASANVQDMLGLAAESIVGQHFVDLLPRDTVHNLRGRIQILGQDTGSARIYGADLFEDGRLFDVSVHLSDRTYLFEFEPKRSGDHRDEISLITPLIARVRRRREIPAMAREAARALKALTGFDRVMVYKFQRDHTGHVIAEASEPEMDKFLGMRFPASDIPKQARELYIRNTLRLIADVDSEPVPITPPNGPDGKPIDLSMSGTRTVSPIHLEYLRNMGVASSMSVSILRDGKLWGLFACHHRTPRYIEFEKRSALELFTQLFAYEVAAVESEQERLQTQNARRLHEKLVAQMTDIETISQKFGDIATAIHEVVPFDGMAMLINDRFHSSGDTPTHAQIGGLIRHLNVTSPNEVHATDRLIDSYPDGEEFADLAAGLLAVPISRGPQDYLLLFRHEQLQEVTWAGNPDKPAKPGPHGLRLTPRESFEAWKQVVQNQSLPWSTADIAAAETLRVTLLEVVLKLSGHAEADRKRAQERQELLIAELNHRVRNILNLIRGLVSQSRSGVHSIGDYTQVLDGRIDALARAHDQLTQSDWDAVSLRTLIETEIDAFLSGRKHRIDIQGDDVLLSPEAFSTLALVVHEMVTNAAKYGALKEPGGSVHLGLVQLEDGALEMSWRESGGAAVQPPKGRGFGTTVIERSIPFELQGEAEIRFRLTGVEATFRIPKRYVIFPEQSGPGQGAARGEEPINTDLRLSGNALVVEDNMIIAMDAADILSELGVDEIATASSVGEALRQIETREFDFALLDVNLGHETSVRVAEALRARNVPFLLATGYGASEDISQAYPDAVVLKKPFNKRSVQASFGRLLAPGARAG